MGDHVSIFLYTVGAKSIMNRTRNTDLDLELLLPHNSVGRGASEGTPPYLFATAPTTLMECELLMCSDNMSLSEEGNETLASRSVGRVEGCDEGVEIIFLCDRGASPSRGSCVAVLKSGVIMKSILNVEETYFHHCRRRRRAAGVWIKHVSAMRWALLLSRPLL